RARRPVAPRPALPAELDRLDGRAGRVATPGAGRPAAARPGSLAMAADGAEAAPPSLTIGAAATLGLVSSLITVVFAILRTKVTALRIGPVGLGEIAEINQLVTLANVATTTMTGALLVNQLAQAKTKGDDVLLNRVTGAAWTGALILSAAAGLV